MSSPSVLLKSLVFTILVPGTVIAFIPRLLARYDRKSPVLDSPIARTIAYIPFPAGLLLYLHTTLQFSKAEGTPSPTDEPQQLVTEGIYQYTRNPMYIGVLLMLCGQMVRFRSVYVLWWTIVCWLGFHRRIIEFEEPHLHETYGAAYDDYCERVPRWIPRLRPRDDVYLITCFARTTVKTPCE